MTKLNRGPSNSLRVESWLNESHSMIGVVIVRRIWGQIAWHRGFQILGILLHPQQSMGSYTLQQYSTYHQLLIISTTSNELPPLALAGYLELVFRACSGNSVQHPHPAGLFKMPKIRSCSTCRHDKDSGAHDWVTPGLFFTYQPSKSMEL